jgi:DNA modification methylase
MKPYYQDNWITLYCGDVRDVLKQLPENLVHTVVTSPPYYGLRDYGVEGQIGLEESPTHFINQMRNVFGEVRRVMRKDATLWLNLGDSYAGGKGQSGSSGAENQETRNTNNESLNKGYQTLGGKKQTKPTDDLKVLRAEGLKPKDLMLIPHRVAIALQEDGFWVRQDIVWNKPNPMPESVTDRCTKAHEYIFLMSKSASYFYDADAVKEPAAYDGRKDLIMKGSAKYSNGFDANTPANVATQSLAVKGHERWKADENGDYMRNRRSVWSITSQPYADAHFATFPTELPRICVSAGTSEKGCCSICGSQLERIRKPSEEYAQHLGKSVHSHENDLAVGMRVSKKVNAEYATVGWTSSCECQSETEPSIVLDPFAGAGTTLIVARELGRKSIGIELNPKYCELIVKRIHENGMPLFDY